jgi:hypothetical protein
MSTKRLTLTVKAPARLVQTWVQNGSGAIEPGATLKAQIYTARLTLDITPELRQAIKLAAIASNRTVADMLRQLLEREFPPPSESRS